MALKSTHTKQLLLNAGLQHDNVKHFLNGLTCDEIIELIKEIEYYGYICYRDCKNGNEKIFDMLLQLPVYMKKTHAPNDYYYALKFADSINEDKLIEHMDTLNQLDMQMGERNIRKNPFYKNDNHFRYNYRVSNFALKNNKPSILI